jgi:hypothetical protein
MKVGKKNIESFYFLGCLLEVIIRLWGFGIFKKKLGHFSHEKILCMGSKSYFSGQNLAKKSPVTETSVFFLANFYIMANPKRAWQMA